VPDSLAEGCTGAGMQNGQAINRLFGSSGDNKVIGTKVHRASSWLIGQALSCPDPPRRG
jgi:hypothetical protein